MSTLEYERLRALRLGLPIEWYTKWRSQGVPHSVLAWLNGWDDNFLIEYTALAEKISPDDLSSLATPLLARNWKRAFRSSEDSSGEGCSLLLLALEIHRLGFSVKSTPDVLHTVLNRLETLTKSGYTYDAVIAGMVRNVVRNSPTHLTSST